TFDFFECLFMPNLLEDPDDSNRIGMSQEVGHFIQYEFMFEYIAFIPLAIAKLFLSISNYLHETYSSVDRCNRSSWFRNIEICLKRRENLSDKSLCKKINGNFPSQTGRACG